MAGLPTSRQINLWLARVLLAFGGGLLLGRVLPPLLWSLGAIALGGYLLLRRRGGGWARWLLFFLLGALIVAPGRYLGSPTLPRGDQVTDYVSTSAQATAWAGAETLVVRNSSGDIEVSGGEAIRLEASYRYGSKATIPSALLTSLEEGRLRFTGVEPSLPLEQRQGVRARLQASVPRGVALELTGRMGDVSAERLAAVQLHTNIGDIRVHEVTGPVIAGTDIGDVAVSRAAGGIEVQTQVGNVWLEPLSDSAPVLAQTDVGDITLIVPPASNARIVASSLSGGLPAGITRRTPTEGELSFGRGTQPIVLKTRIGTIRVLRQ